jgi:hypothetical protein
MLQDAEIHASHSYTMRMVFVQLEIPSLFMLQDAEIHASHPYTMHMVLLQLEIPCLLMLQDAEIHASHSYTMRMVFIQLDSLLMVQDALWHCLVIHICSVISVRTRMRPPELRPLKNLGHICVPSDLITILLP